MPATADPRFERLWRDLGARGEAAAAFADLEARYREPARAYHTLEHVRDCLALLDSVRALAADPVAVEAALWFHDAVYDARAKDNEERSAALAREALGRAGVGEPRLARIERLVLETKHSAAPAAGDAALVVDLDLSILAAERERFERYEAGIRKEYGHLPDEAYRSGRAEFLKRFLAREHLFATEAMRERFEGRARTNLERSLQSLLSSRR
ncbi:MAG TPA: hypothetical protein VGK67_40625 [Myxococcales bacterium]